MIVPLLVGDDAMTLQSSNINMEYWMDPANTELILHKFLEGRRVGENG
jgi:hypothetical protein